MSIVEELSGFPGLRELPAPELSALALNVTRRELRPGDTVIQEAQPSRSCFFLVRGRVEVRKTIAGQQRHLNSLSEGTMFGQIGLIDAGLRTASVVATTPVVVLELLRSDYDTLLATGRMAALRVQEQVALGAIRQLRTVTHRLSLLQDRKVSLSKVREAVSDWNSREDGVQVVQSTAVPPSRYRR